jgi:hypothetical protein
MRQSNPWQGQGDFGDAFGSFGASHYGGGFDATVINANSTVGAKQAGRVSRWSGASTVKVRGTVPPIVGATVCKSGARTGWTCGKIVAEPREFAVADVGAPKVAGFTTTMCSASGDSGAPVLAGSYAVGIISFGTYDIKTGDGPAACAMKAQLDRYFARELALYPPETRKVLKAQLIANPGSRIFTGVHPLIAQGASVDDVLGKSFRVAVYVPKASGVKAVAKGKTTVVKGKVAVRGTKAGAYRVKVRVKNVVVTLTPKASGKFTARVPVRAVKKKTKASVIVLLAGDAVQKSAKVTKKAR